MALNTHSPQDIQAAFLCNDKGEVCIAFDDPAYVCSDVVFIDQQDWAVHAVLHESDCLLGYVSPTMAQAFGRCDAALLTALRTDGSIFEMMAPISGSARKAGGQANVQ